MHKRALFVTNSSSCCHFIYGFRLPEDTPIDYEKYAQYMRRKYDQYHSAAYHNLPVQIEDIEYVGEYAIIDSSVQNIDDGDGFRPVNTAANYIQWNQSILEFCASVGIDIPIEEVGWHAGIVPC
jgi:hypothetical protein